MNKAAIICKLHEITDHYLLGAGTWPADNEFLPGFRRTVRELDLDEEVPESPRTTRSTAFGKELIARLADGVCGISARFLNILEAKGYLEESEAEELCTGPLVKAERKLRWYVLRAYLSICNRSHLSN
jgi:hypothetical protein